MPTDAERLDEVLASPVTHTADGESTTERSVQDVIAGIKFKRELESVTSAQKPTRRVVSMSRFIPGGMDGGCG